MIENILILGLIPLVFVFLMILINHNFIEGGKKKLRLLIFFTRFITLTILIVALAAPYTSTTRTERGDTTVSILIDNSKSMDVFDIESRNLIDALQVLDGVNSAVVGEELASPIGNAILNNMLGNENILLISDGNSNRGKNLEDVLKYASSLNTTVNAIELDMDKTDSAISIKGPKLVLSNLQNTYYIKVTGNSNYEAVLKVDGVEVKRFKDNKPRIEEINLALKPGYHKFEADLITNDYNSINNKFYKVVSSLDKPKVLYISNSYSPIEQIFEKMYNLDKTASLPSNLDKYFGVIVNNMPPLDADKLSNFVIDGNGLLTIGGKNSYDLGSYDTSEFQTLLPVKVGNPKIENVTDLNIVMVIDISISSGLGTEGGKVVDIEKAQAVNLFNQLSPEDYLGVIAFNNEAHTITWIDKIKNQPDTPAKIYALQDTGGTYMETGLISAEDMLIGAAGNKNIVIISDGKTKNPDRTLQIARNLRDKGINIYAIGVGEGTDEAFMEALAFAGGGNYFKASVAEQISLLFSKERNVKKDEWKLTITSFGNFITKGIALNAKIYGYNQVVPKSSAQMLVATGNGIPVLSIWRFGLGRVASLSTDGGNAWAGELLKEGNSKLISRTSNWVVGDPRRKQSIRVSIEDGRINEALEFKIYSESTPSVDGMELAEVDKNIFAGTYVPESSGFFEIMGEEFAVNYPREYEDMGVNPYLEQLVELTGGQILEPDDPEKIIEKIKKDSERTIEDRNYYRYILLPAAVIFFLIDIFIRRKHKKHNGGKK